MSSGCDILATVHGYSREGHVIATTEIVRGWASGNLPGPIRLGLTVADRALSSEEVATFVAYARGLSPRINAAVLPDERPFVVGHRGIARTSVHMRVNYEGTTSVDIVAHSDGDIFIVMHGREYALDRDESRVPYQAGAFRFARNLWRELGFKMIGSEGQARYCGSNLPEDHALWEVRDRIRLAA